ncbi:hypothetical protein Lesp02_22010 [Lentzea sp. NBRC 105346]|nr:hypothetical protein Lesp02_22010 [Lentzea sp. NBRC 105346]
MLGTRWKCTATLVMSDGTRHPFRNGSSLLTPDDVGKSIPMVSLSSRRTTPSNMTTARDDYDPRPWDGATMLLFILAGIVGGLVMWPWKTSPRADSPQ